MTREAYKGLNTPSVIYNILVIIEARGLHGKKRRVLSACQSQASSCILVLRSSGESNPRYPRNFVSKCHLFPYRTSQTCGSSLSLSFPLNLTLVDATGQFTATTLMHMRIDIAR
jgi:hypothetical protein